ncbi:MAG: nucleotidyl transferase AbiEii/AbiGii toxin family protein [Bacteroidota bacterium]
MIKPGEIQKAASANNVSDTQIEKDYIISWILFGISRNVFLNQHLVFKGGTVLKKVYFNEYRFSEDLDFTLTDDAITNENIFEEFENVFAFILDEANIQLKRISVETFQTGNMNCYVVYGGPMGGTFGKKDLKLDFTRNEQIIYDVPLSPVFRNYSDLSDAFSLQCYSLSEVLVEKMRSLIERSQPRDIYDLWFLLDDYGIALADHIGGFHQKMAHKGLEPSGYLEKLKSKESVFKGMWDKSLKNQIHQLPDFDGVFRVLMKHFRTL